MNLLELENIIKEVIVEEQDYQRLFKSMLSATGKDINSMSDEDKKKFFNAVDKAYKAKTEGRLTGYDDKLELNEFDVLSTILSGGVATIMIYRFILEVMGYIKLLKDRDKKMEDKLHSYLIDKILSTPPKIYDYAKKVDDVKNIQTTIPKKIANDSNTISYIDAYMKNNKIENNPKIKDAIVKSFEKKLSKGFNNQTIIKKTTNNIKDKLK